MHERLLCLDIETVPDGTLTPPDWNGFPKLPWHRVVAISVVEAAIERANGRELYHVESCRSGGEPDWDEGRLLRSFWRAMERGPARVVTWNGRGFDLPVLKLRSMIHVLSAASWHSAGTKWANYAHRYATDWHCDLMEVLSDYGAAQRLSLHDVAQAMGFPGKVGGDGSEVANMWERGEVVSIRSYCECDVLNTFGFYVRWALLTGRSNIEDHDQALKRLAAYLEDARQQNPLQGEFLDAWRGRTRNANTD